MVTTLRIPGSRCTPYRRSSTTGRYHNAALPKVTATNFDEQLIDESNVRELDGSADGSSGGTESGSKEHLEKTRHPRTVDNVEIDYVVAPDGSWLASASIDGQVRIWDPASSTANHTLTGHTSEVRALVVAPDGSWLASTGDDGQVRIWDPITGAPLTSLRVAGRLYLLALTSTTIAAAGEHGPYFLALCHGKQSR